MDTARMDSNSAILIVSADSGLDAKSEEFARGLIQGAESRLADLDARIQETAQNWALDRMAAVDRNILRLASYELLNCPETPASVVIDEALEIAKLYSAQDSSKFINGILDKIQAFRPPPHAEEAG